MITAWLAKNAVYLVVAIFVFATAWVVFDRLILQPMNAKHDAAATAGANAIAGAGVASAADAVAVVSQNSAHVKATDDTTRKNYVYITKQPGASDPVNPAVFDAFTRSVCLRDSAAGLPECDGLRKSGS